MTSKLTIYYAAEMSTQILNNEVNKTYQFPVLGLDSSELLLSCSSFGRDKLKALLYELDMQTRNASMRHFDHRMSQHVISYISEPRDFVHTTYIDLMELNRFTDPFLEINDQKFFMSKTSPFIEKFKRVFEYEIATLNSNFPFLDFTYLVRHVFIRNLGRKWLVRFCALHSKVWGLRGIHIDSLRLYVMVSQLVRLIMSRRDRQMINLMDSLDYNSLSSECYFNELAFSANPHISERTSESMQRLLVHEDRKAIKKLDIKIVKLLRLVGLHLHNAFLDGSCPSTLVDGLFNIDAAKDFYAARVISHQSTIDESLIKDLSYRAFIVNKQLLREVLSVLKQQILEDVENCAHVFKMYNAFVKTIESPPRPDVDLSSSPPDNLMLDLFSSSTLSNPEASAQMDYDPGVNAEWVGVEFLCKFRSLLDCLSGISEELGCSLRNIPGDYLEHAFDYALDYSKLSINDLDIQLYKPGMKEALRRDQTFAFNKGFRVRQFYALYHRYELSLGLDEVEPQMACELDPKKERIAEVYDLLYRLSDLDPEVVEPQMNFSHIVSGLANTTRDKIMDILGDIGLGAFLNASGKLWDKTCDAAAKSRWVIAIAAAILGANALDTFIYSSSFSEKSKAKISFIAGIVVISVVDYSFFNIMLDKIAFFLKEQEREVDVEPQMGSNSIVDFTFAILSAYILKDADNLVSVETVKKMAALGNSKKGLVEIIESMTSLLWELSNKALSACGLPSLKPNTGLSELDHYFDLYDGIMRDIKRDMFPLSIPNFDRLDDIVRKGEAIVRNPRLGHTHGRVVSYILGINKEMTKLRDKFKISNVTATGLRQEPFMILYFGPPGVGKSHLLKRTANHIVIMDCKSVEELNAHLANDATYIYNRQVENKFWEGMTNLIKVVIFDDAFQLKASDANPDGESMGFIRYINTLQMMCHMADLPSKGNQMGMGIAGVGTTNAKRINPEDIVSPQALIRRINCYFVSIKPEYRVDPDEKILWNVRLDTTKLPMDSEGKTYIPDSIYEIYKYDGAVGLIETTSKMSYREFIETIRETYFVKLRHYETNQSAYKESDFEYYQELEKKGHYKEVLSAHESIAQKNVKLSGTINKWMKDRIPGSWEAVSQMNNLDLGDEAPLEMFSIIEGPHDRSELETYFDSMSEEDRKRLLLRLAACLENTPTLIAGLYQSELYRTSDMTKCLANVLLMVKISSPLAYRFIVLNIGDIAEALNPPVLEIKVKERNWKSEILEIFEDIVSSPVIKSIVNFVHYGIEQAKKHPMVTFVTGVIGIWSLVSLFLKDEEVEFQSVDYKTAIAKQKLRSKTRMRTLKNVLAESQISDDQGAQIAESVINKNVVDFCTLKDDGSYKVWGRVLFVKERIALVQQHYLNFFAEKIKENPDFGNIIFSFRNQTKELDKMLVRDFFMLAKIENIIDGTDMVLMRFPKTINNFQDITSKFIKEDTLVKMKNFKVYFSVNHRDLRVYCDASVRHKPMEVETSRDAKTGLATGYILDRYICYDTPTRKGDCGTPLFVINPLLGATRIIGTHSAGSLKTDVGYAGIVSQEELLGALKNFNVFTMEETDLVEEDAVDVIPQLYTNVRVTDKVKKPHVQHAKHDSVPSVIQSDDVFVPKKGLSVVKDDPAKGIFPMYNALSKQKTEKRLPLDEDQRECYNRAILDLREMIMSIPKPDGDEFMTLEEILWGDPENEHVNAIKSSSSPGFIHKIQCPNLKKALYGPDAKRDSSNPAFAEIKKRFDKNVELIKKGIIPFTVFTGNLKLEKLPLEKVEQGKSRMYYGCDMDANIILAWLVGRFREAYLKAGFNAEHSFGINQASADWEKLTQGLRSFSEDRYPNVLDADYKAFDTSHDSGDMWVLWHLICEWFVLHYSSTATTWRNCAFEMVVNARVVVNKYVFTMQRGQPSGWFLTSLINSLTNSFNWRYCFYRILQKNGFSLRLKFKACVWINTHGDDVIAALIQWLYDYMNQQTVPEFMAELGFEMTSADKSSEVTYKFKSLDKATYLKRNFRYDETLGMMVGPLSTETVEETFLWTNKYQQRTVLVSNLNDSLREASLHGLDYFNEFRDKIIKTINNTCPEILPEINLQDRTLWLEEIFDL